MTHVIAFLVAILFGGVALAADDPLPSWNETPARAAIIAFVEAVSTPGSPEFVAPEQRIAVFDNDGALWVEQPIYTQLAFAMDRVKALASAHPEWANEHPFKAVLENDRAALADAGVPAIVQLVMATHVGITTDEFAAIVTDWLATARHPRFDRPYTDLVYQPMLELLAYLRANGFETWIVSRWYRIPAAMDRYRLWSTAGTSRRLLYQDTIRDPRRHPGPCAPAGN